MKRVMEGTTANTSRCIHAARWKPRWRRARSGGPAMTVGEHDTHFMGPSNRGFGGGVVNDLYGHSRWRPIHQDKPEAFQRRAEGVARSRQ